MKIVRLEKCYASTHRIVNAKHTCRIPGKLQKIGNCELIKSKGTSNLEITQNH